MLLTLDAGNSYFKLALWEQGEITRRDRLANQNIEQLLQLLQTYPENITRTIMASVVADDVNAVIELACRDAGLHPVERFHTTASCCGLTHSYPDPAQHGSDRWAALVGAASLVSPPLCVVDAGTAITVDLLAADKSYAGGLIMPGSDIMQTALKHGTRAIESAAAGDDLFADNTAAQVASGCQLAASAGIAAAVSAASEFFDGHCEVLVTGGLAATLLDALPGCRLEPDLVMLGLYTSTEPS